MSDLTKRGTFEVGWNGRIAPGSRLVPAVLVVGLTAAIVLLAWGAAVWEDVSITALWLLLGAGAVLAFLRRRFAGHLSQPSGATSAGEPFVVRRDSVAMQSDARRHRRFVPVRRATTLHLQDGRTIAARIVDLSIAGVAVEARMTDLDFASVSRVGTRSAGPVRRTRSGAVFGFEVLLDPQPFDASFVL